MAHIHGVFDSDVHFSIDPISRAIKNELSNAKTKIIQYDHDSERFTFELPRYIEGHDMLTCNVVQVHYINVGAGGNKSNGVYEVDDLQVSPEDENVVICSWLISRNATQFVGSLNFVLRFVCSTYGELDYVWHTGIYNAITVAESINNSDVVVDEYADILEEWRQNFAELITDEQIDGSVSRYMGENFSAKVTRDVNGKGVVTITDGNGTTKVTLSGTHSIYPCTYGGNISSVGGTIPDALQYFKGDTYSFSPEVGDMFITARGHICYVRSYSLEDTGDYSSPKLNLNYKMLGQLGNYSSYTPVKGKDYFTEEDVNEIAERVLNSLTSARISEVALLSANWVGSNNLYHQVVAINGVTENSQVDLTPSVEQLVIFYDKDLTFVTENEDGVVTVYAIGQKPENDYTIQVTITEVSV